MRHMHRLYQRITLAKCFDALRAVIDSQLAFQNIGDQRHRMPVKRGNSPRSDRHHGNGDLGRTAGVLDSLADNRLARHQQFLHRVVV